MWLLLPLLVWVRLGCVVVACREGKEDHRPSSRSPVGCACLPFRLLLVVYEKQKRRRSPFGPEMLSLFFFPSTHSTSWDSTGGFDKKYIP